MTSRKLFALLLLNLLWQPPAWEVSERLQKIDLHVTGGKRMMRWRICERSRAFTLSTRIYKGSRTLARTLFRSRKRSHFIPTYLGHIKRPYHGPYAWRNRSLALIHVGARQIGAILFRGQDENVGNCYDGSEKVPRSLFSLPLPPGSLSLSLTGDVSSSHSFKSIRSFLPYILYNDSSVYKSTP